MAARRASRSRATAIGCGSTSATTAARSTIPARSCARPTASASTGAASAADRADPPRSGASAAGFFPRPPGAPAYVYRGRPRPATAGAPRAAGDMGIDEAALARIVQYDHRRRSDGAAADADPFDARRPSRPARARGIFLRPRPRHAARHPLGGQDLRLGDARRGADARRRICRRRPRIYPLHGAAGPVRQSRPAQGADHPRPSDDPQRRARLQRQ